MKTACAHRWARCIYLVVLAFWACQTSAVLAQSAVPAFDGGRWLTRVQQAASTRSYHGTMMFSGGGIVSSSRISHLHEGKQRYERIEVLDGQPRQQLRHNDIVLTLWSGLKLAVFEAIDTEAEFPALPAVSQRLLESYELRLVGFERIAGQEADVVMVKPKDSARFAHRLWAERATGLLLRADVIGPRGEVLESSAFTELSFDGKLQAESVLSAMKRLDGYRVVRSPAQAVQADAEGWDLPRSVPGFALISCTRRSLQSVVSSGEPTPVLQAVFSDGMTHVSMFIEHFDPQRHRPMRTSLGAAHTSMHRRGDWWITIVGDVPMATVAQFQAGLQRR